MRGPRRCSSCYDVSSAFAVDDGRPEQRKANAASGAGVNCRHLAPRHPSPPPRNRRARCVSECVTAGPSLRATLRGPLAQTEHDGVMAVVAL